MDATVLPATHVSSPSLPAKAVGNVLVVSGLAVAAIVGVVLIGLNGWSYYTTPATVRGYHDLHRVLRPAGSVGQLFGIAGFLFMLVPVVYAVRKRLPQLRNAGTMKTWLNVHIFCGIVGPVLVTFHTSFKFNGLVSVAYWSMVLVLLSGFVGRYLFVRIPRSVRGVELSRADLDKKADELRQGLSEAHLPASLVARIAAFERGAVPPPGATPSVIGLFFGEMRVQRELSLIRREIEATGMAPALLHEAAAVIAERATLLRHVAYLSKTKAIFNVWHVFHMPLVYVMFGIVVLHVAITLYMGYVPLAY